MFGKRQAGGSAAAKPAARVVPLRPEQPTRPPRPAPGVPTPGAESGRDGTIEQVVDLVRPLVARRVAPEVPAEMPRGRLAKELDALIADAWDGAPLEGDVVRDAITALINGILAEAEEEAGMVPAQQVPADDPVTRAMEAVQPRLLERIDVGKAGDLPRAELATQVGEIVGEMLVEQKIQLNGLEQRNLVTLLLNDMLGLGPLEPLLADEAVTDIMVNGAKQVYVERKGKLELSNAAFRDDAHVMNVATRIVSQVGRRVDESSPLCDARLTDGSRVNIIIPPLAIDGPSISIRKFAKKKITLESMEKNGNLSPQMASVLRIASRARLNILISGGTGSGKTTLLNALSRMIDHGERIVTIEDAAELQLQQPHVVRLETRPPNLEGTGEITQRELVKNALRMRPDRIILGEIRAGEALDMLQAMNTGHDGSLGTIHANNPREALTRLENMVAMTGVKLPHEAVRAQIASAIHLILQVSRMRDGVRRITAVTEVVGMEGEVVTTQDLFNFTFEGEAADGRLVGAYKSTGLRPYFMDKAKYFGLDRALMEAME